MLWSSCRNAVLTLRSRSDTQLCWQDNAASSSWPFLGGVGKISMGESQWRVSSGYNDRPVFGERASRRASKRGWKAGRVMELDQDAFLCLQWGLKRNLICSALALKGLWLLTARLSSGAAPACDAPGSWLTAVSSPICQLGLTGMICELFWQVLSEKIKCQGKKCNLIVKYYGFHSRTIYP